VIQPRIQYAKTSDGVSIAVATLGEGPPLGVVLPPYLSHVQLEWDIWPYVFQTPGVEVPRGEVQRPRERAL